LFKDFISLYYTFTTDEITEVRSSKSMNVEMKEEPFYQSFLYVIIVAAAVLIAVVLLVVALLLLISCIIKFRRAKLPTTAASTSNPHCYLESSGNANGTSKCDDSHLYTGLNFSDYTVDNHNYDVTKPCDDLTNMYETIQ